MSDDQNSVVTLKVRVTPQFREKIIEASKINTRSMNAEIVHRLEQSFSQNTSSIESIPTEALMMELANRMKGYSLTVEEVNRIKKAP